MKPLRQLFQRKARRPRRMARDELLEWTNINQWLIGGSIHDAVKKILATDGHRWTQMNTDKKACLQMAQIFTDHFLFIFRENLRNLRARFHPMFHLCSSVFIRGGFFSVSSVPPW